MTAHSHGTGTSNKKVEGLWAQNLPSQRNVAVMQLFSTCE